MKSIFRCLGFALVLPCVFVLAAGASAQTAVPSAPAPAQAAGLPSAESVIERHIEAIGGRKALEARKSARIVGTLSVPANGMTGTLEMYAARPNKVLVKQSLAGVGEILEGFDGTHAWSINPMTGPMLATGEELAQRAQDADFDAALNVASRYTSLKTLEKTTFDGRECYKVALTRKDGTEDIEFYDAATGLKAGSINTRKSPMGSVTVTTTLKDYKKTGDILQPMTLRQSLQGIEMVTTFTSVEFDTVDPSVFELPAPIKALVK
ncbi:MAG TPA: hypothetical protein VM364_11330 [Vicinamibacterales bacterium]|nr:hypothetical protein [Vicinamibacterales bacterium]